MNEKKKCVIVFNPNSGNGKALKCLDKIVNILSAKYDCIVYKTEHPGHAIDIVKGLDDDVDLVISLGGDGTFKEVATGNINRPKKLVLSQIPLGTANDLKNNLYLRNNTLKLTREIMDGEEIDLDILSVNGNIFFYAAALGFISNVPYETPSEQKHKHGHTAYVLGIFKELLKEFRVYHLKYTVNGQEYEGDFVLIIATNTKSVGGFNGILDKPDLTDGKFEFRLVDYDKKSKIILNALAVALHIVPFDKKFRLYVTDKVILNFDKETDRPICLDGEEGQRLKEAVIKIDERGPIKVRLPSNSVKKIKKN